MIQDDTQTFKSAHVLSVCTIHFIPMWHRARVRVHCNRQLAHWALCLRSFRSNSNQNCCWTMLKAVSRRDVLAPGTLNQFLIPWLGTSARLRQERLHQAEMTGSSVWVLAMLGKFATPLPSETEQFPFLRPALSWEICRCWRRILLLSADVGGESPGWKKWVSEMTCTPKWMVWFPQTNMHSIYYRWLGNTFRIETIKKCFK